MTEPASQPEPARHPASSRWIVAALCWAYVFLLIGGVAVFRSRLAMPIDAVTEMSSKRATFFVANAATLTGFQTSVTVESLRPTGQIAAFVLMVAGAALSWIVGGILVARALRLPVSELQIIATSAALLLLAALIGAFTLPGGGVLASIFDAISAITNSGLWIGPRPTMSSAVTAYMLVPLAVIGGLGITIIVELWRLPMTRAISHHARGTMVLLAIVYLLGGAVLFASSWLTRGFPTATTNTAQSTTGVETVTVWQAPAADASLRSLNARSAGLPMELLNTLDRPSQWITAMLMLIGAGSGGAAGGLKVTTLAVLIVGVARVFRGETPARIFGIAAVWLGSYVVVIALTFFWLLGLVPEQSADRLLMLSISAVGNVGLSHDVISASGSDAYILSIAMIAGRIMPLAVLAWIAAGEKADVVVG